MFGYALLLLRDAWILLVLIVVTIPPFLADEGLCSGISSAPLYYFVSNVVSINEWEGASATSADTLSTVSYCTQARHAYLGQPVALSQTLPLGPYWARLGGKI